MRKYQIIIALAVLVSFIGFQSCSSAGGEYTGAEYMPDMAHSVAYEANVYNYYYYNTWDEESKKYSGKTAKELGLHNKPVKGTIPRGYAGVVESRGADREAKMKVLRGETTHNAISVPINGEVPYYIPNTLDGRNYANVAPELMQNPYPITEDGLDRGKELYEIYCGVCHGNKGDGSGILVENPNSKYPAAPTNYLTKYMTNSPNGKYYHTIMHGKGVMGSHSDKLSYEERWQVIHYIRALQAKKMGLAYNQYENTLNEWATPFADTDGAVNLDNSKMASTFDKMVVETTESHASFTLENVFFETGSATLKAKSKLELNELAAVLAKYETTRIELAGHTDNTGSEEGNMTLSELRAQSVKAYLESKGVESKRLESKGYGASQPRESNVTEEGRAKNRRTEFSVLSK